MQLLVSKENIIATAPKILYGVFDEPIEKWALLDEQNNVMLYYLDDNFSKVENVKLPSDFEEGKYFYKDGEFVFNEYWQPYISEEDKIAKLEVDSSITQNAIMEQQETSAVLEEELLNTQMALVDQYETNILLEEELTSARDEITELQLAICDLYEALI